MCAFLPTCDCLEGVRTTNVSEAPADLLLPYRNAVDELGSKLEVLRQSRVEVEHLQADREQLKAQRDALLYAFVIKDRSVLVWKSNTRSLN